MKYGVKGAKKLAKFAKKIYERCSESVRKGLNSTKMAELYKYKYHVLPLPAKGEVFPSAIPVRSSTSYKIFLYIVLFSDNASERKQLRIEGCPSCLRRLQYKRVNTKDFYLFC